MRKIIFILIVTLYFNSESLANPSADTTERKAFNKSGLSERRWNRYKQSDYTDLKLWALKRENILKAFGFPFSTVAALSPINGGPIAIVGDLSQGNVVSGFIIPNTFLPLISLPFFIRAKKYEAIRNENRIDFKSERFFRFGLKFGLILSDLNEHPWWADKNLLKYYLKPGVGGGAFICFNFNKIIGMQTEVLISRKGRKYEQFMWVDTLFVTEYLDYLDIPIQFKTTLPIGNKINPSFYIGPCISFLLDAKRKGEFSSNKEYNYKESIEDIKTFDIGYAWGLSFDFPLNKGMIILDIKNIEGAKMLDDFDGSFYDSLKNRMFSILVGYSL